MAEKANCNEKNVRSCVFNDYNNNGGESYINKEQVSFMKPLASILHCELVMYTIALMNAKLAVSSVSADCWESKSISKHMAGHKS